MSAFGTEQTSQRAQPCPLLGVPGNYIENTRVLGRFADRPTARPAAWPERPVEGRWLHHFRGPDPKRAWASPASGSALCSITLSLPIRAPPERATAPVLLSCPLMSPTPQKRHENDQSNERDNDNHNLHFWILETLICDHKCSSSVALTGAKRHDPLDVNVRSTQ